MAFTDWRQMPSLSDAIQVGGWVWRGVVAWDKTEAARPQKGWFRTGQMEYVLLGSKGPMPQEQMRAGPYQSGVFRASAMSEPKHHITGKPVALMSWLLSVMPSGSKILDPFCGSGSTLLACRRLGMEGIGVEMSRDYCKIAQGRLEAENGPAV